MRCSHCGDYFTGDCLEYVSGKPFCSSCRSDLTTSNPDFARCYKNCQTPFGKFLQRVSDFFSDHILLELTIIGIVILAFFTYTGLGIEKLCIISGVPKWISFMPILFFWFLGLFIANKFPKFCPIYVVVSVILLLFAATAGQIESRAKKQEFTDLRMPGYEKAYYLYFTYDFQQEGVSKVGNEWHHALLINGMEMTGPARLLLSPVFFARAVCTEIDDVYYEWGEKDMHFSFEDYSSLALQKGVAYRIPVSVTEKGGPYAGRRTTWVCTLHFRQIEPYSTHSAYFAAITILIGTTLFLFVLFKIIHKKYYSYSEPVKDFSSQQSQETESVPSTHLYDENYDLPF